jgi:aspartyl protease
MRVFAAISLAIWAWAGPFDQLADAQQNFSAAQAVSSSQLHMFVPVSINGTKPTWWLVDTGAPVSIVSHLLRQRLSLPEPPAGSGINPTIMSRGKAYSVAFAISINLNGTELGPDFLRIEQINHLVNEKSSAVTAGFEKGGIIGLSQLLRRGTVINYKTLQLFLARGSSKLPLTREGYEKMGLPTSRYG